MTNLEFIQRQQAENIEEFAKKRLKNCFYKWPTENGWRGDFNGIEENYDKAIEREIEWLKEEKKND